MPWILTHPEPIQNPLRTRFHTVCKTSGFPGRYDRELIPKQAVQTLPRIAVIGHMAGRLCGRDPRLYLYDTVRRKRRDQESGHSPFSKWLWD